MKLYLIRHAIAFDRDPVQWPRDGERPLTPDGVAKFRQAARGLASLVPSVDAVLSSPYVRAWDTALLLEQEAQWPGPQRCDALTGDQFSAVIEAVEAQRPVDAVALVGHEPYLSALASTLLRCPAGPAVELKKGAVAHLEVGPSGNAAILRWLLQPKVLRQLA